MQGGQAAQIALGDNRVDGELTGIQIAAVNIGRDVSGAQVGLVNIARRVDGVQLGLVNVADRASAPIGAVSWMHSGERAIEVWGGEALSLAAGVRMGTGRVYSIAGIASGPLVDGRPWGLAAGAGVKVAFDRVAVLIDALGHALFFDGVDDQALLAQARARVAYDVTEQVSVAAGPTWNVFVSGDVDGEDLPLGADSVDRSGDTTVRQWPGLLASVAMRFLPPLTASEFRWCPVRAACPNAAARAASESALKRRARWCIVGSWSRRDRRRGGEWMGSMHRFSRLALLGLVAATQACGDDLRPIEGETGRGAARQP